MVSTRGVKLKFFDGERVLCYEPDPTKAKVLYDSKVLEVIVNKDQRGRKTVEYLIHFQGWNSSWDRCVSEDFVLKDTPENRQLQKDLAEKAQLQLGAYLYRRERKKRKERKLSDRLAPSSEDGSSGSPALMDTDDGHTGVTSSSDSGSSGEEELLPLELTPFLRSMLEHDHFMINSKHKLHRLPAEPHVVSILEQYWRHYAANEVNKMGDKPNARNRHSGYGTTLAKVKPEVVQKNLNTCRELVDGLRVYFDFTLSDLLLYDRERDQVVTAQATVLSCLSSMKMENNVKNESEEQEYSHLPSLESERREGDGRQRRWMRSHGELELECNGNQPHIEMPALRAESTRSTSTDTIHKFSTTLHLLPDHAYNQDPPPPSLMYGATHLARLLVKLPEFLIATSIQDSKLKLLLRHLDFFAEFLSEHKDWFGDKCYVDSSILH